MPTLKGMITPNILITTDHIFIKLLKIHLEPRKSSFWKSYRESIPPPNTSNGAPDQTKTAGHIFMKILREMYIGIRKSSLQFESHP